MGRGAAATAPTPVYAEAPAAAPAPGGACYSDRDVTFPATQKGITIAGTLSVPSLATGRGPFPAALMITGNGPHTREQRISNSPMFTMIADHLARRGFVVLRTDARGQGKSTGPKDEEQNTLADRVGDNRAALEFLRQQREVDPNRIILLGHSEGAMIAAELAASGARPALSIFLSTSTLPGREVFARQRANNLLRKGATGEASEAVYQQLLRFADFLASPDRGNRAMFDAIALDFLVAHGVPRNEADPKFAQSLIDGFLRSPWTWYFVAHDPRVALRKIDTPVLAVFGGMDDNLVWREHAATLTATLGADLWKPDSASAWTLRTEATAARADTVMAGRNQGNADLTTVVLPDQDHFFLEYRGHRMAKHVPGKMEIADELYAAIDAELTRRGLARAPCGEATR